MPPRLAPILLLLALCASCAAPRPPAEAPPITLAERGPTVGVELVQLLADASPATTTVPAPRGRQPATPKGLAPGQLFEAIGTAPRAAEDALARWKSVGLGVRVVRVADIPALIARLAIAGPAQQQFVNLGPARFQAARGPTLDREVLALDSGELPVERAAVRLLVRAWPVPPTGDDATPSQAPERADLQLELVPDVQKDRAALAPLIPSLQDEPALLTRFALEAVLAPDEALVVFPLAPVSDAPAPLPQSAAAPQPADATPVIIAPSPVGPDVPALPTLAQAILTDTLARPRRGVASVVFIIPHPPTRYTLLPSP